MKFVARGMVLLLAISIIGCGGKKTDKTGKTGNSNGKNANAKPLKELVIGTWESKFTLDEEKFKKIAPPDAKAAAGLKEMLSKAGMMVEVKDDGTYVRTETGGPKAKQIDGTWTIESEDGRTIKLKTKEGDETDTITLKFTSDDEYEFTSADPAFAEAPFKLPMIFKRKK